ncbi:MAG: hypothetical protein P8Y51_03245 [Campylobacterales bacterium]
MALSVFSGLFSTLLACTGDCLTCHPKLVSTIEQDARHKPMLTCIKCHSADPNAMAECGSECFACHPVEKIEKVDVEEHRVIRGCRDCHVEIKEALSNIATPKDQSTLPPLKELLMPSFEAAGGLQ